MPCHALASFPSAPAGAWPTRRSPSWSGRMGTPPHPAARQAGTPASLQAPAVHNCPTTRPWAVARCARCGSTMLKLAGAGASKVNREQYFERCLVGIQGPRPACSGKPSGVVGVMVAVKSKNIAEASCALFQLLLWDTRHCWTSSARSALGIKECTFTAVRSSKADGLCKPTKEQPDGNAYGV